MSALERHYSIGEIAALWNLSEDTTRALFRDEPDVVRIGTPLKRRKRAYITLRIPESIVQKVHEKLRRPAPCVTTASNGLEIRQAAMRARSGKGVTQ
jgi:hypothetical protein